MERSKACSCSSPLMTFYVLSMLIFLVVDHNRAAAAKTCLCTPTQTNCQLDGRCRSTRSDFACVVMRRYDSTNRIHRLHQQCVLDGIQYGFFCNEPPVRGLVVDDKKMAEEGTLEICCFTEDCNTEELLREVLANLTRPPTTIGDDVLTPKLLIAPASTTPVLRDNNASIEAPAYAIPVITILCAIVVVIVMVIVVTLYVHCMGYPLKYHGASSETPTIPMTGDSGSYGESSLNELLEDSGSGSGLPLLIQRSIAGQIALHELIGKGRFGEVWKGTYKGDEVAVKIFHTKEEMSWFHEVELYQTCLIRHPNILRFIAADNKDIGIQTQLWLITEFCEYGSLYDLLIQRTLDEGTMLKICYTAACGLDHLHAEVVGTEGKPAIAHRDLKSRNILVKCDFSCCIADLGLALRYRRDTDTVEDLPSKRVGTKRYLAPEIIDETISFKNFEAYKQADMYSFGLVLWEVTRRGECGGHYEEAQLPYYDVVPMDPSYEDMKKAVVIDKRRPTIPNQWSQSELFRGMAKLMQQCWLEKSEARLTTLRLKKNLANLHSSKSEKSKKEEQS